MITIENEILITLIGTFVVVLSTVFQIWSFRRAKFMHIQKMLALENSLNEGNSITADQISACKKKKCSLFCNANHLLQIIFGILVFVSFTCWAVYLVSRGFVEWAPLPGFLALIGLATPIMTWRAYKHRHQTMSQLIQDIEICKKAGVEEDKKAFEHEEPLEVAITESQNLPDSVNPVIVASGVIDKPEEAVHQIIPETVVLPEKQIEILSIPAIIEKQKIPQDSILKRHFFTTLRTQVESNYPSRPSDSILKRHFENFIATEMEKYIDKSIEPVVQVVTDKTAVKNIEPAVKSATPTVSKSTSLPAEAKVQKQKLPQDSILRRHFLSKLYSDIEYSLPPPPTDSILKRHYSSLILTEMGKRLDESDA
jgi:hypothetical protein